MIFHSSYCKLGLWIFSEKYVYYNMFPIMIVIPKHTYNLLGIQLDKICSNHNQSTICDLLLSLKMGLLPVYLNGGLVQR